MNLQVNNLFSSPLFIDQLELDIDSIKSFCYKMRDLSEGRKLTNVGGWQSENLPLEEPELQVMFNEIINRVNLVHNELGFSKNIKQKIDNSWININKRGNFNRPHIHPGAIFSGVVYINCSKDSGNINFLNPVKSHIYHIEDSIVENFNGFNSQRYFQTPEVGKLLFFPGWLEHYVDPNDSDTDRVSISFNTTVDNT
jgi:uncharacterized protein (TIGR02466 family)